MDTMGSSTDSRTAPTVGPTSTAGAGDDWGLSIDMLDADRLREWARLIEDNGSNIAYWGDTAFVAGRMLAMARGIERAVRDIGAMRKVVSTRMIHGGNIGGDGIPFFL